MDLRDESFSIHFAPADVLAQAMSSWDSARLTVARQDFSDMNPEMDIDQRFTLIEDVHEPKMYITGDVHCPKMYINRRCTLNDNLQKNVSQTRMFSKKTASKSSYLGF